MNFRNWTFMPDDAADRFAAMSRVSIRAVIAWNGEDVSEALLKAGITNPVTIPVVLGDGDPIGFLGAGGTPNLTGMLEFDAPAWRGDFAAGVGEQDMGDKPARVSEADGSRAVTLPPAYGLQPLAPVRRPALKRWSMPRAVTSSAAPVGNDSLSRIDPNGGNRGTAATSFPFLGYQHDSGTAAGHPGSADFSEPISGSVGRAGCADRGRNS